ncbi:MAG: matrixin family metalloprotease, partial [Planctomycetes bacterium]|nr:matrixin family metalloprotease [Planctomycetota bacterium]
YTPDAGFTGTDTFDYTVSDGNGGFDTATVTVTVEEAPPPGESIGINLVNVNTNTEANYGGVVMDASDTAGVEVQSYWNNLDEDSTNSLVENDGSGGYQPTASQQYMDSEGNLTNLSVVWNTGNAVDGSSTGTSNGDQMMMSGTSQAGGGSDSTGSLSLSNVPYTTYDVIVYMAEPVSHSGSNIVTVTDGSTTYYIDHGGIGEIHTPSTATSAGAVSGEATYVRFNDLSGATTITHDNNGSSWKSGMAGLQIVSAASPMMADVANSTQASTVETVEQSDVDAMITAALSQWAQAGYDVSAFADNTYVIADLEGDALATYENDVITLDVNAAGYGWFIDSTPLDDSEFDTGSVEGMDLLTVLTHELGHDLGIDHVDDALNVMNDDLATGERLRVI